VSAYILNQLWLGNLKVTKVDIIFLLPEHPPACWWDEWLEPQVPPGEAWKENTSKSVPEGAKTSYCPAACSGDRGFEDLPFTREHPNKLHVF
jgi:hypothetical protein